MHINTEFLAAFLEIYRQSSFTKAASALGLSQPALSQKMAKLEEMLQATLFIRAKNDLSLTASGEKLLIFAKQQLQFERDFIASFDQYNEEPAGVLRLAGFSSITQSVLIPSLAKMLREYPKCFIEFNSYEVIELEDILKKNKADIVVSDYKIELPGTESLCIGAEEYVIIESKEFKKIPEVYIDHGPHDNATESFFVHQGLEFNQKRTFMGDVNGIIEGVKQGLGKAIMSKHLVKDHPKIRIKKSSKKYLREVYLCYLKQSYYSPLHHLVVDSLAKNSKAFLF